MKNHRTQDGLTQPQSTSPQTTQEENKTVPFTDRMRNVTRSNAWGLSGLNGFVKNKDLKRKILFSDNKQ